MPRSKSKAKNGREPIPKDRMSRRVLISAAAGGASLLANRAAAQPAGSSKLRLSLACWNYDRTRALMDGRVPVDGVELTYLTLPVEETFFRMLRHHEFDVAELSLSSYVLSLSAPNPPFIAFLVLPSRFFRHSCIYVTAKSGIHEPKDLIGKRVGTPEYQMTAGVWIRGILSDEYQVPAQSMSYFTGGEGEPGRDEKIALSLPAEFKVQPIPANRTLSQMLESGELDAFQTARAPSAFTNGSGKVEKMMGTDFWPYGLEKNMNTLTTFLRYSYEQGLSKRQLTPRELFAPESLESFKI